MIRFCKRAMEFEAIPHLLWDRSRGSEANGRNTDRTNRGGTNTEVWKQISNKIGHHEAKYLVS